MFLELRTLSHKRTWSKDEMARMLVMLCMKVLLYTLVWALLLKSIGMVFDRDIDLSDILTFAGGTFGGELVLLAVKHIFSKGRRNSQDE